MDAPSAAASSLARHNAARDAALKSTGTKIRLMVLAMTLRYQTVVRDDRSAYSSRRAAVPTHFHDDKQPSPGVFILTGSETAFEPSYLPDGGVVVRTVGYLMPS